MSQTELSHSESGHATSLISPDLPFLGSLKALISCLLAMKAEHMVCLKILVKHLSINLTVGSAKEQKQELSQTFTSSPKQTHLPLKNLPDLQVQKNQITKVTTDIFSYDFRTFFHKATS